MLILDGNLEIGAHVISDTCLFEVFVQIEINHISDFFLFSFTRAQRVLSYHLI